MYSGTTSPIFDVPEFPTLRRIKPLPKRRRTTGSAQENTSPVSQLSGSTLNPQNILPAFLQTPSQPELQRPSLPIDSLIPNATPDELLSHVDNISTRIALQNYYLPILGNVQNFLAGHGASADSINGNSATAAAAAAALAAVTSAGRNGPLPMPQLSDLDSIEFGVHFAAAAAAAAAAGIHMGGLGSFGLADSNMNSLTGMATVNANETSPLLSNGTVRDTPGEFGSGRREEGDEEEDYSDRLRRPSNTKKRKVPANLSGSPRSANTGEGAGRGSQSSSYLDGEDTADSYPVAVGGFSAPDTATLRDNGDHDRDRDYDSMSPSPVYPPPSFPGQMSMLTQKKGKLTAATLAGLQHKEMLKARKRQLGSVMGALSHGDSFVLDHALSIHFPLGGNGEPLKVRKSKRRSVRLARAMTIMMETPDRKNRHPDAVPFPESDFEFKCPSATSSRLGSTKEEVAALRRRFEAELERQADKAAKTATSERGKVPAKNSRAKRERQEKERGRAARAERQKKVKENAPSDHLEPTSSRTTSTSVGLGASSVTSDGAATNAKNGKKKKRSALANASNPHHLRNYIPSRLPHSGPLDAQGQGTANNIWPLPVRFLTAEVPPRISKGSEKASLANPPLVQVTQPGEEWICAFCEYDLFYSDELAYRRAVRNRKRILRRRRRAAERAAAAASGSAGNSTLKAPPPPAEEDYDGHGRAAEIGVAENGSAPPQRSAQWKGGPGKEPTAYG